VRGYVLDRYGDATAMTLREVPAPAVEAGSPGAKVVSIAGVPEPATAAKISMQGRCWL